MFNLFKKKQRETLDVEKLREARAFLESSPKIEYNPYPLYDQRIYIVLNSLGVDDKYMKNSEKIMDAPIETMSLENLKTMYTFILRSEKFSDGTIAKYVEDGSLAKMVKRELELL